MAEPTNLDKLTIKQAAPAIFKRPLLSINVHDKLLGAATFMAIGPQIYVDGLVVTDDKGGLVGRLGNQYIMYHILESGQAWLDAKVSDLLDQESPSFEASTALSKVLEFFEETRFAFAPVTVGGKLAASLSLRDLLGLVSASEARTRLREVGSQLISIDSTSTLGDAFRTITEKQIRNVGIIEAGKYVASSTRIINDRKILEFLLSHEGRQVIHNSKGISGMDKVRLDSLSLLDPKIVSKDVTISSAAPLLQDVSTPCILADGVIVTPWDLVIKGMVQSREP